MNAFNDTNTSQFAAGSDENAENGYDPQDHQALPTLPFIPNMDNLKLTSFHDNWGENSGYFMKDMRSMNNDNWNFELNLEFEQACEISIEEIINLPDNYDIFLINEQTGQRVNLRNENMVIEQGRTRDKSVDNGSNRQVVTLELNVELTPTQADQELNTDDFVILGNYPNPFSSSFGPGKTNISFTLPEAGKVKVEIFDIKGRLVKRLKNGRLNAGIHNIYWSGKNTENESITSGLYFCKISYENNYKIQKIMVIK